MMLTKNQHNSGKDKDIMDFIIWGIGGIILSVAARLLFCAGMRLGSQRVRKEYKDHISLEGLSNPSIEKLRGYEQCVRIWDEHRGPNRHLYKPVHID